MRSRVSAVAAAVAVLASAPAALAHSGNPHYLSQVDRIAPSTSGITVDVLNRDDRLLLHNTSGKDVLIEGYEHEPYARLLADGTVQVNTDSPAFYLNDDRYGEAAVPKEADGKGAPRWKELDKTGRFEWHDHRIHWMSKTNPPQIKDESVKSKIFDWSVPIVVGGEQGAITGTLSWTPLPGGSVPWLIIVPLVVVLCGAFFALSVIRRRRAEAPDAEPAEAW